MTATRTTETTPIQGDWVLEDGSRAPGHFDYDLIQRMIWWAEGDQTHLREWRDRFVGKWNQGVWGKVKTRVTNETIDKALSGVCGTAFCMAGQAVVQKGYRIDFGFDPTSLVVGRSLDSGGSASQCVKQEPTGMFTPKGRPVMRDVGYRESIPQVAEQELGLTTSEASMFFGGDNKIEHLKRMANGMCEQRKLPAMFYGIEDSISPHNSTYVDWLNDEEGDEE